MSKPCKNCGRELPDAAAFCPYCETVQTEKQQVTPPRRRRRRTAAAVLAVVIAPLAVGLGVWGLNRPAEPPEEAEVPEMPQAAETPEPAADPGPMVYHEGGADVTYGDYRLVLAFDENLGEVGESQAEISTVMTSEQQYAYPSQLFALQADTLANRWEDFLEEVESCTIQTYPEDGAEAMDWSEPVHDPGFATAALTSNIFYTAACGTNEIRWTLTMKNGDVIVLCQQIHAILQKTLTYYPEDAPMNTLEELQTMLDTIEEEVDPETAVTIYLPPVIYEGGVTLDNRGYNFIGTSDGETRTTFTGTVSVRSQDAQISEIFGVDFAGNGGVGVDANRGLSLQDCTFTGWDTAVLIRTDGWVSAETCLFDGNGVGIHMDTSQCRYLRPDYFGNRFTGNGTAFLLTQLPYGVYLSFTESVFSGNGTDIDNQIGVDMDISGATFA